MPTPKPGASPFAAVAEAFRKLWITLASIPPEACGNPQHSGWNEPFRRSGPLVADFNAAVSEARRIAGVLAPVAEAGIQAAETLVAELIDRLNNRSSDRLPGLLAMECIRVGNALRNLAAMTATMPAAVRNWLTARYLADPTPGKWQLADDAESEPVVFVRYEDFAAFLVGAGVELLPNLDDWKNAGWIEDVMVDLTPSDEPNASPPYPIARLNLPFGRHRLVGIRSTVLNAPTEPAPPNAAPPSTSATPAGMQQGEGEELPADPYADLREFARTELKGQERAVIEALCDAGGERPITDLAVVDSVGWNDEFEGFKNAQKRLNPKLMRIGWTLARQNNAAKLNRNRG